MQTIQRFAKKMQARTARMNRNLLLSLLIIVGALGSSACFLVIYQAFKNPPPLQQVWPAPNDSLIAPPVK
jgi:hypothetical protein